MWSPRQPRRLSPTLSLNSVRKALGRCVALLLSVVLLTLWPQLAHAANDPALEWWTIETKRFQIHYPKRLEPVAERLARLSEDIHQRLIGPLGHVPDEVTHIALTDITDRANGSATGVPYNAVRLFVTAPDDMSPLSDYDDWYLGLMTHEYTHILHVDNMSGIPSVVNAVLGKTFVPNQVQPRWIIEGLAVVAESKFSSGGRIRSSLFDMYLRADVLENNFARLDQISSSARRWPQGTMWYLYGARFMQWIADVYGMDALRAVSVDYGASILPWGINRAIRRQTGRTYVELYAGFEDHLRRQYARQMHEVQVRGRREGWRVTRQGRNVFYPVFVPPQSRQGGDYELIYYADNQNGRAGLFRLDLSLQRDAAPPEARLLTAAATSSRATFSPDGDILFSSVMPYKRIYRRSEIFSIGKDDTAPQGIAPSRKQLTHGLRALAPNLSPSGREIAFTVNNAGTTTLNLADYSATGKISNVRPVVPTERYDQNFTPQFSPDGQSLAYSRWIAGGFRDIYVVHLSSGRVERITNDRAIDGQPCWSPDGRSLYFSSDRTGIHNIYVYDLASRVIKQVTNVRLGAFMPAVSQDGKLLAYVGYTSAGHDLFAMKLDPSRFLEALPDQSPRPSPYAEPPPVAMTKRRYNPFTTLRPRTYAFDYVPGNFDGNALTLTAVGQDIADLHSFEASVIADPAAPAPQLSLQYSYLQLPFDLTVRLNNSVVPRSGYRFNGRQVPFIEHRYAVRTGFSHAIPHEWGVQRFGISHNATLVDSDLPVDNQRPFDPYSPPTRDPFSGLLSLLHLGYSYSNAQGAFDTSGPASGFSLNLGLDIADPAIGSEDTLYSVDYALAGYLPMPWPGHHTLAVRSAGGMSKGTFSGRGVFFVGGYNLDDVSLLDTITSGALTGGFALRGYPPGSYSGSNYMLQNLEYRVPVADVDTGISTVPLYFRRLSGNLFFDFGGAFDELDFDSVEWLSQGALLYSPQLQSSAGAELWFDATVGYVIDMQLRLGYAYGFSAGAEPGGQMYFITSSAF